MHRVTLNYSLEDRPAENAAPQAELTALRELHHPLMALLDAIHRCGSISGASRLLGLSYRHVWGELRRWEAELGRSLVVWVKGQPAVLAPFGEKLLWAERRALARLAPQIEALRVELQQAFAIAFDDHAGVIPMYASHDHALPRLREFVQARHQLHLDIQFTGSVDALAALNNNRCLLAGFHALTAAPSKSPTAKVYRPMLKPGVHKLLGFARRSQGLMLPAGNPLGLKTLADVARAGARFVVRQRGSGTAVVLDELLQAHGLRAEDLGDSLHLGEPSHRAAAEAVASGSADAAFGVEAAAREKGLDFIALAQESYFLVVKAAQLEHPHVRTLLAALSEPAWAGLLHRIPGYASARSGEVLSLRSVLPWWTYRTPKR